MSLDERGRLPEAGRAVVTGGAGFVGSWLCQRLLQEGHEVWAVDSLVTGSRDNVAHLLPDPCFHLEVLDVCDPFDVPGAVDLVLHLASPASPVHYLRMPVETLMAGSLGTTQALELARRKGARFLMASTSEVYGDPLEHPQRETYWGNVNPVGPRSVYDEAKRFSEALTVAYRDHRGVDAVIARIFNTYGPRMADQDGRVVPTFVHQALAGEPLTVAGDGSQTRSLCFVEDTVEGLLRLAGSGYGGAVNIGNDRELTVLAIAELVRELTGSDSAVELVDLPVDDPKVRRPDITRAKELLGWRPRTAVGEGLGRTVAWMAAERSERSERAMVPEPATAWFDRLPALPRR